jgi:single-stranded DNA-binding protein
MNIIAIIGKLTKDPEIMHLQSETAVANFDIAI